MSKKNQDCRKCGKEVLFDKGQFDGRDFIAEGTCECGEILRVIQKDVQVEFSDGWVLEKNE